MANSQFEDRKAQALIALRTAIKDIKIFVWAGDYENARRTIQDVYSHYGEELRLAYELRKEVLKAERTIRKEISSDDEETLSEQQLRAMNAASKNAGEIISGKTGLFSLGVLASILLRLDKRISEEINEKTQIPKNYQGRSKGGLERQGILFEGLKSEARSNLEYIIIPLGENRLELRAFRFKNIDIDPSELEKRFEYIQELNLHKTISVKNRVGEESYPYKFVGFSKNAHVEVTILDFNRIKIYVAVENSSDAQMIILSILQVFE